MIVKAKTSKWDNFDEIERKFSDDTLREVYMYPIIGQKIKPLIY